LREPGFSQLAVYCRKHFPGREIDIECMAEAAFLEHDYWQNMQTTLTNAIIRAFNG